MRLEKVQVFGGSMGHKTPADADGLQGALVLLLSTGGPPQRAGTGLSKHALSARTRSHPRCLSVGIVAGVIALVGRPSGARGNLGKSVLERCVAVKCHQSSARVS